MTADRTPALLAALNVSLKAQQGLLTDGPVEEMTARAQELEAGDPHRVAALLFASTWRSHRHNRDELARLGEDLHRSILRAVRPDPVDHHRRDIHG